MTEIIKLRCPECDKAMNVPARLAGKKVRCKSCEAVLPVPPPKPASAGKSAGETFQLAKESEQPRAKASAAAASDEDENNPNPYKMKPDDFHLARCVFCAQVLDPPDARVCPNCGFDMVERKRHQSKSVYQNTLGDYLNYHALTILAVLCIIAIIALNVYCLMNMDEWFVGSIFEKENEKTIAGKQAYWVGPDMAKTWIVLISLGIIWYAGRFVFRMLMNFHPLERPTKG